MNEKQLHFVRTLAEEGSFSRAAEVLGISQPYLSQSIKKLENEYGVALFDRAASRVRLTDAGKIFVETGLRIADLNHVMEVQFSDLAENKTGSLIIGTTPYRSAGMIPAVARKFQKKYPGMHLVCLEGTTVELTEALERGAFDLCVTLLPVDTRLFAYEKVFEEEIVLAVPSSYPPFSGKAVAGRRYEAIHLRELDQKKLVMMRETQYMQKITRNVEKDYRLRFKNAAVVSSIAAQIAMVRAGVGMAIVPSGVSFFTHENEVNYYSFVEALPKREVACVWRKDRALSEVTQDLKRIICQTA